MHLHITARKKRGISQRQLAEKASLSFRTIQLLEWGRLDPRISTLQKLAKGLGYPSTLVESRVSGIFSTPPDSVAILSERLVEEGEKNWKIWFFNFVDTFRDNPTDDLIREPPVPATSPRLRALLASTIEALCYEKEIAVPEWCGASPILDEPWFVSEMESLKASALVESPVPFRKRNIFVLGNFLQRA